MAKAAGLSGNVVRVNQALQCEQDRAHGLNGVSRWIDADDGIAAAVKQSLERSEENPAGIVSRMVRLNADSENAAFAHGVSAASDIADSGRGEHQILVAHDFGYGGYNLGGDRTLQLREFSFSGRVVEQALAKFSYCHACDASELVSIIGVQDEAGYVVFDQR